MINDLNLCFNYDNQGINNGSNTSGALLCPVGTVPRLLLEPPEQGIRALV